MRRASGGWIRVIIVAWVLTAAAPGLGAESNKSADEGKSRAAVEALEVALAKADVWGEALAGRDIAKIALTKADAAKARELLWKQQLAPHSRGIRLQ